MVHPCGPEILALHQFVEGTTSSSISHNITLLGSSARPGCLLTRRGFLDHERGLEPVRKDPLAPTAVVSGGVLTDSSSLPAAATTATTSTIAATTATTATTTPAGLFLGFVDLDGPSIEVGTVHLGDCLLRRLLIIERYETEPTRTPGVTIGDDLRLRDLAEPCEGFAQAVVRRIKTEPAYKELLAHVPAVCLPLPHARQRYISVVTTSGNA
jgi:hypothetical protein